MLLSRARAEGTFWLFLPPGSLRRRGRLPAHRSWQAGPAVPAGPAGDGRCPTPSRQRSCAGMGGDRSQSRPSSPRQPRRNAASQSRLLQTSSCSKPPLPASAKPALYYAKPGRRTGRHTADLALHVTRFASAPIGPLDLCTVILELLLLQVAVAENTKRINEMLSNSPNRQPPHWSAADQEPHRTIAPYRVSPKRSPVTRPWCLDTMLLPMAGTPWIGCSQRYLASSRPPLSCVKPLLRPDSEAWAI